MTGLFTPAEQPEPKWLIWKERKDGTREYVVTVTDRWVDAWLAVPGHTATEIVPQWPWEEES